MILREKTLLAGFGIFLLLTFSIGVIGFLQIRSLAGAINEFGRLYLPRERVVLEMKNSNALYAMRVRNYVFWRVSRYLQAVSAASDKKAVERLTAEFNQYLQSYSSLAETSEQKGWVNALQKWNRELVDSGNELLAMADGENPDREQISKLLMAFENKYYRIDDFLSVTVSKYNLADIENKLKEAAEQKDLSMSLLLTSLALSMALGAAITFLVYRSFRQERRRSEAAVQKMIHLEEAERKNLSRQIHDQLSQDLSALKIYLDLIEKSIQPQALEQMDRIAKSRKILVSLIDRGHNISALLRPPELDELGLVESIAALISEHRQYSGCAYEYLKPKSDFELSPEYSLALYRVVQEVFTNIVKYAGAKKVSVSLERKGGKLVLRISDDGKGFDYQQYLRQPQRRSDDKFKLGLQGLHERIELLGGKFTVKSVLGKGTLVEAELTV